MDDINSTLKISDILYDSKNNHEPQNIKIKTEPCYNIKEEDDEEGLVVNLQEKFEK